MRRLIFLICVAIWLPCVGFSDTASMVVDKVIQSRMNESQSMGSTTLETKQIELLSQMISSKSINSNQNYFSTLMGKWKITLPINSTVFTEYMTINNLYYDTNLGYIALGYKATTSSATTGLSVVCSVGFEPSKHKYVCLVVSSLGEDYTSWYYLNTPTSTTLTGAFDIDNATNAAINYLYGQYYALSGVKLSSGSSSSSSSSLGSSTSSSSSSIASSSSSSSSVSSEDTPPTPGDIPSPTTATVKSMTLNTGWNLIGMPLKTADKMSLNTLLQDKATIAWKFNVSSEGVYSWEKWTPTSTSSDTPPSPGDVNLDSNQTIANGEGIFVGVPSSKGTVSIEFSAILSDTYTKFETMSFLNNKWYLLGFPYEISVASLKTLYPDAVIWVMKNNQYVKLSNTDYIGIAQGFWFKSKNGKVSQ